MGDPAKVGQGRLAQLLRPFFFPQSPSLQPSFLTLRLLSHDTFSQSPEHFHFPNADCILLSTAIRRDCLSKQ
jgi:hypothetical protein